jgi:hypothetical protein
MHPIPAVLSHYVMLCETLLCTAVNEETCQMNAGGVDLNPFPLLGIHPHATFNPIVSSTSGSNYYPLCLLPASLICCHVGVRLRCFPAIPRQSDNHQHLNPLESVNQSFAGS